MLSGYPPFDGDTEKDIFDAIETGEYDFDDEGWEFVSEEAKLLIANLLCPEKERMSAK